MPRVADYEAGRRIAAMGYSFAAVIQAAMRLATVEDLKRLKRVFPSAYDEFAAGAKSPATRANEVLDGEMFPDLSIDREVSS